MKNPTPSSTRRTRGPDPERVKLAEDMVLYRKDPKTKIATIALNRPERLNAPTGEARERYAKLLNRAQIDDDVKVLIVRGVGDNLGAGADVPDLFTTRADPSSDDAVRLAEFGIFDDDVTFPPEGTYRRHALYSHFLASAPGGCRSLQEFKKISIVEAKGYCYGWHFYQCADADLVISSDDALFGHPAYRYAGWGPRMWQWAQTMGMRKFMEMVFTGRPFTAHEMYDCNFVNRVVPRDQLEAEVEKYALACSRTRPTDTVFAQKVFFEVMKQHQGEYMGSILTAWLESMGSHMRSDVSDDVELQREFAKKGLNNTVKDNDDRFPPEFRLSKSGRKRKD